MNLHQTKVRRTSRRWMAEVPFYPDATGMWWVVGFGDSPDEAITKAEHERSERVRCEAALPVDGVNDAE